MNYLQKLNALIERRNESEFSERIVSELVYLDGISKVNGDRYNRLIEVAADHLFSCIDADGVITKRAVYETEELLSPMADAAKAYDLLFIAHAHIDMNWMWGYNETAAVTVDTFRTVLDLMDEYPELTFAQSQASTYEIIEKFAPDMLPEIRARIREGRWEVTASEWVEPDKNMPNGESLTRQILQTKRYLSRLLEIREEDMCINFVPDTFGHNANVPEILTGAGVKYLYHCRGYETPCLYRFAAPSGASVLASREFSWYNADITTEKFECVPSFCTEYGVDTMLAVYGVGDHGGGPTRRDIERILKYRSWPYTPNIRFGTFMEYFKAVERKSNPLPVHCHELNAVFTGCYTTQSRIKMANRIGEARLNEAEALQAMDNVLGGGTNSPRRLDGAWQRLIFNHFHDILPGSGTVETREYALGRFQELMANAVTTATAAERHMMSRMNTEGIDFDTENDDRAEGAGVGYFQSEDAAFRMPSAERGRGKVRALTLFNPTPWPRDEYSEVVVWDYPLPLHLCEIVSTDGGSLPFAEIGKGASYWNHKYQRILVHAPLAPYGYSTVILRPIHADGHAAVRLFTAEHTDEAINDEPIVLENELIRAVVDPHTFELNELYDKRSGAALIDGATAYFRLAEENPVYNMSAWRIGPIMKSENLNQTHSARRGRIVRCDDYTSFSYTIEFGSSELTCEMRLTDNSDLIEYNLTVDWHELPEKQKFIPQLAFMLPNVTSQTGNALYEIPYGRILRPQIAHDVVSLSFIGLPRCDGSDIGIVCDTKYGFRYEDGCASLTLIRSAYHPDPYPERGIHHIRIGLVAGPVSELKAKSDRFCHPVCYASHSKAHTGDLPLSGSLLSVTGCEVSCLKVSEDGSGITLRLCEVSGEEKDTVIALCKPAHSVELCDDLEHFIRVLDCDGNRIRFAIGANCVETVRIRLK